MTLSALFTDQELVGATRRGDDRAFEQLYARYRQRMTVFAYRMTRDHDRADDITQEVFISALRRIRESDRPIAFRPWIYEIARNACIDEHRRSSRTTEVPIERDGDTSWVGAALMSAPPEAAVESKQRLEDLRGAFRGLSERHHRVIVLRELEGLSYSQIGDELGMSKMVVESTLFRARRRLTEEYEDLSSGRRCDHVRRLISADSRRRWSSLGLRDRRAMACHLEHCRSCRRLAREAGWEQRAKPRPLGKVAALLPIPLLKLPGRFADRLSDVTRGVPHAALPSASTAAQYADPIGSIGSAGRAAAAAATLLVAAVGGGIANDVSQHAADPPVAAIAAPHAGPVVRASSHVAVRSPTDGGAVHIVDASAGGVELGRPPVAATRRAATVAGGRGSTARRHPSRTRSGTTTSALAPTASPIGVRHNSLLSSPSTTPTSQSSSSTSSAATTSPAIPGGLGGPSAPPVGGASGSGSSSGSGSGSSSGSAAGAGAGAGAGSGSGTPSIPGHPIRATLHATAGVASSTVAATGLAGGGSGSTTSTSPTPSGTAGATPTGGKVAEILGATARSLSGGAAAPVA